MPQFIETRATRSTAKAIGPQPRTNGESQNSGSLKVNIVNIVYVLGIPILVLARYRRSPIFRPTAILKFVLRRLDYPR